MRQARHARVAPSEYGEILRRVDAARQYWSDCARRKQELMRVYVDGLTGPEKDPK